MPTQARSRATVQAILQAGAHVLSREGYERATTNRVAAVAGVSIGTLYQYFDDREALFDAVVEEGLGAVVAAAEQSLAGTAGATVAQQLEALGVASLRAAVPHAGVLRQLAAVPGSTFQERLREARQRSQDLVRAWLWARPDLRLPDDLDRISRLVTSLGVGLLLDLEAEDDVEALARSAARMVHVWLASGAAPAERLEGAAPDDRSRPDRRG